VRQGGGDYGLMDATTLLTVPGFESMSTVSSIVAPLYLPVSPP
jgi:hypothetical protein